MKIWKYDTFFWLKSAHTDTAQLGLVVWIFLSLQSLSVLVIKLNKRIKIEKAKRKQAHVSQQASK